MKWEMSNKPVVGWRCHFLGVGNFLFDRLAVYGGVSPWPEFPFCEAACLDTVFDHGGPRVKSQYSDPKRRALAHLSGEEDHGNEEEVGHCGIHVTHSLRLPAAYAYHQGPAAYFFALAELWGVVAEYEHGYRGQFAKVTAALIPERWYRLTSQDDNELRYHLCRSLRERGVEVRLIPNIIVEMEFCAECWFSVDPRKTVRCSHWDAYELDNVPLSATLAASHLRMVVSSRLNK